MIGNGACRRAVFASSAKLSTVLAGPAKGDGGLQNF